MVSEAKIQSAPARLEILTRTADAVFVSNQNGKQISQLRFPTQSSRAWVAIVL
jgi:hypothetical protein